MLCCTNVDFSELKYQTHFSQDVLFIGCDTFFDVMVICLHVTKHVFKIYE